MTYLSIDVDIGDLLGDLTVEEIVDYVGLEEVIECIQSKLYKTRKRKASPKALEEVGRITEEMTSNLFKGQHPVIKALLEGQLDVTTEREVNRFLDSLGLVRSAIPYMPGLVPAR